MEQLAPADAAQHYEEYREFTDGVRRSGQLVDCNRLMPTQTATTVRVRNGKISTTDGPFAETKEQLGGYFLVEARDLNDAIAGRGAGFPAVQRGCVEMRPVVDDRRPAGSEATTLSRSESCRADEQGRGARDGRRDLSRRIAPRARDAHPPARRFRSRRGGAARRVRRGARAVAARRRAGQSARVARLRGPLQGDRRDPPPRAIRRVARRARRELDVEAGDAPRRTTEDSRTTGCG